MLQRVNRLRRSSDILRARRSRLRSAGARFTVHVIVRHDEHPPRVGIVVGQRVSRSSVDRHRLTRQMREVVRALLSSVAPGVDVLIVAHRPASAYAGTPWAAELQSLLRTLKVLR